MPFKTYHSVAGNMVYKAMLSLLLPHPPRGSYTSNRLPLLPSLFRAGRYEIVWDLNVSKRDKIAVFFFLAPNFGPLSKFLYQLFLRKSANFANNLKNELFEGRDELFEQLRVSRPSSWTTFSKPQRPHEVYVPQEKCMCCCKRRRTARSSIRMGWYHMFSEASAERFVLRARSSPSCASECV